MLISLARRIAKYATLKTLLPAVAMFLTFVLYLFPRYKAQMNDAANSDKTLGLLDGKLAYAHHDVMQLLTDLGVGGREVYMTISRVIDTAYPLVYCVTFMLLIALLLKRVIQPNSILWLLIYLPFAGMIFDYAENHSIQGFLTDYPHISESAVQTSSMLTSIKWTFLFAALGVVLIMAILAIWKCDRKRQS